MVIKKVLVKDLLKLQEISRKTFYETFSDDNSEDNIKKYLENGLSYERLKSELKDTNSEFYFANQDSKIIGYLKLNFGTSQTELQDNKALEIERIYVLKDYINKGIGQTLLNKAVDRARDEKLAYAWLGVWEKNHNAIEFYKKNGFTEFDNHVFHLGDDPQIDIMMKLHLDQ